MNKDSKSLFFLCLSLVCIWLILDNIYGQKYVNKFLGLMFDFMNGSSTDTTLTDVVADAYDKATTVTDKEGNEKSTVPKTADDWINADGNGLYNQAQNTGKGANDFVTKPSPQYSASDAWNAPVV